MDHIPDILEFHSDDLELLPVEELSRQLRVSQAFVRLCIDCGCTTRRGLLSGAELLHWLFENYQMAREASGLTRFAPTEGLPAPVVKRLKMANAILTLTEYSELRATDPEQKRALRAAGRLIENALERA